MVMSEYQYYEFQAVDRCLTKQEMGKLRSFSSRANITAHSFINEYSCGNFKGDEDLWMEKYFDGFLYYANWGTHILKLRIPSTLLDLKVIQSYCDGDHFSVRHHGDKFILDFLSENEDGGEWEEDLRLTPFLSLRTDLIRGDLRCLYLGWLSVLQSNEYDEEEFEPPVPPGLQNLNPALEQLADFLRVDFDLLNAAAQMSPPLEEITPNSQDLQKWLSTLSQDERDSMLSSILESSLKGDQTNALSQVGRFSKAWQSFQEGKKEKPKKRTVGELLRESENVRQARVQFEAEKAADFPAKFNALKQRHSAKSSFIQRLRNITV
jgi:hypothetical protein